MSRRYRLLRRKKGSVQKVYWGTGSGVYQFSKDVGNQTSYTMDDKHSVPVEPRGKMENRVIPRKHEQHGNHCLCPKHGHAMKVIAVISDPGG
jgi:hypothetical protein